jgi:hypothetical protein
MARTKKSSPTVNLAITEENWERAIQSASGGCLIADPIKELGYTGVSVDMATIRFTDPKEGKRYTYLTPNAGQHLLLSFDQGWPQPIYQLSIKRAVKIDAVTRSPKDKAAKEQHREERRAELEAKVEAGEALTSNEKATLTRVRNPQPTPDRPSSRGPIEIADSGAVVGGAPLLQGKAHPNLLRGRNRHFGAKLSDPGEVFRQAVEAAVEERLNGNGE